MKTSSLRYYQGLFRPALYRPARASGRRERVEVSVFIVDTGEDTGPVAFHSNPVDIPQALSVLESGTNGLLDSFEKIVLIHRTNNHIS
jgi:hypothetical protein